MENISERIYKSALKFLFPLSPEETYRLIIKECLALTGADYGSLLLKNGKMLERVYANSPYFYQIQNRPKGSMYQVLKQNKMKILNVTHLTKIHPVLKKTHVCSIIAAPLSYKNVSIGVMALQSKKLNYFQEKESSIVQLFRPLATLAIRKVQLYEEVRKALETRDLFISMAAHELRTPLTVVSGYIQLLHGKLAGTNTTEARWVEQLANENVRLTNLVNELLEINRIKSGKLKYILRECHLSEILLRIKEIFKFSHPHREIIIEDRLGGIDVVIGDYDKILQMVSNLLSNAIKFSAPDSKIRVTLADKKSNLLISVQDKGIGISKKDLPKITEGYHQGEGHNIEGMGLGLFLVKDIVTRLQGKLKIHSKVNKGTTIQVLLPKFHE